MMRFCIFILAAICLSLLETSFFASFRGMIRYVPLVFVVSVYVLQHHSLEYAPFWMIFHGMFLDFSRASTFPLFTFAYLICAWVAYMSAKHLFSNRSFYGVFACASLSELAFEVSHAFFLFLDSILEKQSFHVQFILQDAWYRYITMLLCLIILFSFAKQIRYLLVQFLFIPKSRQTY